MAFKYRDSGEYAVEQNQLWRVGKHLYACSDVATDTGFHELVDEHQPYVLYADPPWSNALTKQFRTLTDLPPPPYEWTAIWEGIVRLAPGIPHWLVGDRYREAEVRALLPKASRPHYRRWSLGHFTSATVIGVLHYSGLGPAPVTAFPVGTNDEKLPLRIMEGYDSPGSTICDPCSGLGITSRRAEEAGWSSLNNEIAPVRVSAALRRMEKMIGVKPQRLR